MTLSTKINIDVLDFIRSGRFDCLKLGQTKEWILNNFPDPNDIGIGDTLLNAKIWFYGNIELHFDEDGLFLIFSDHIIDLDGGQFLALNKWILDDPADLTLSNFISNLNAEHIDFSKKTEQLDLEYIRLKISKSNVQLTFIQDEDKSYSPSEFRLSAFSLIRQ